MVMLVLVRFFQVGGLATLLTFFNVYLDAALEAPTWLIGVLAALGRLFTIPIVLIDPRLWPYVGATFGSYWPDSSDSISHSSHGPHPHWSAAGLSYMGVIANVEHALLSLYCLCLRHG